MNWMSTLEGWRKYIVIIVVTVLLGLGMITEEAWTVVVATLGLGSGIEGAGRYLSGRRLGAKK